jgi:signal peptidase I
MGRRKKEKRPAWILRLARHFGWKPGRVMSEILEWVEVIIVAGFLAFLVMTIITVRMHVPTDSMFPAIDGDPSWLKADSFFVDMISYYFRAPKPGDIVVFWHTDAVLIKDIKGGSLADRALVPDGERLISINREPVFNKSGADAIITGLPTGTMVVLGLAGLPQLDLGAKQTGMETIADFGIDLREKRVRYVKRLIAVGGQTVEIKAGDIYIDGVKLDGERFDRYYTSNDPRMRYGMSPTLVPEGKWLVLGDNSDNSWDSRFWGFVDQRDFIGEPYFRVWPFSRFGPMNGYFHL